MIARHAKRLEAHQPVMTANLIRQVTGALGYNVRDIAEAERLRTRYWHRLREFMQNYDYIMTPTLGVPAFRLDQPMPSEVNGIPVERFADVLLSTYAFSITGLPVIALPCGWNQSGLPMSLQIVGHRHREDSVLEAACAYEAAHPEHFASPVVDLARAKPVHGDFTVEYSGFVSSATRL
jgi:amidase